MGFTPLGGSALAVPAAWSSGTSYAAGDLAIRDNALFIASQAHSNQDPRTDCATVLAGTYWTFFALRGESQNYVSTAEAVTSTSLALATTPDEVYAFCPAGKLFVTAFIEWKLTGTSLATSSAFLQVDDTAIGGAVVNGGSTAAAAQLSSTGTFWSIAHTAQGATPLLGQMTSTAATGSDANIPSRPFGGNVAFNIVPTAIHVAPGFHKVNLKYAAGNGTTTLNVRERRLGAMGA